MKRQICDFRDRVLLFLGTTIIVAMIALFPNINSEAAEYDSEGYLVITQEDIDAALAKADSSGKIAWSSGEEIRGSIDYLQIYSSTGKTRFVGDIVVNGGSVIAFGQDAVTGYIDKFYVDVQGDLLNENNYALNLNPGGTYQYDENFVISGSGRYRVWAINKSNVTIDGGKIEYICSSNQSTVVVNNATHDGISWTLLSVEGNSSDDYGKIIINGGQFYDLEILGAQTSDGVFDKNSISNIVLNECTARRIVVPHTDDKSIFSSLLGENKSFSGKYEINSKYDELNGYNYVEMVSDSAITVSSGSENQNNETITDSSATSAFVSRMYSVVLGREADEAGLNDWVNRLSSGSANAVDIVQGFMCSDEYKNKGKSN
ncbi:MAG: DUF4214 domain-containing protein, partial [Lachnospiraceae bacterium]|nr:DUF4214 domain-containing protein [Lachnospiraceae bacterium]